MIRLFYFSVDCGVESTSHDFFEEEEDADKVYDLVELQKKVRNNVLTIVLTYHSIVFNWSISKTYLLPHLLAYSHPTSTRPSVPSDLQHCPKLKYLLSY